MAVPTRFPEEALPAATLSAAGPSGLQKAVSAYCMNQPCDTTIDWPVSAVLEAPAK